MYDEKVIRKYTGSARLRSKEGRWSLERQGCRSGAVNWFCGEELIQVSNEQEIQHGGAKRE